MQLPADNNLRPASTDRGRGAIVRSYVASVLMVCVATLAARKIQPVLGEISAPYFVAVMLSAWFGGIGPGLLATLLSGASTSFFFIDIPKGTGTFGLDDGLRLAVFLMVALLISFLLTMRRLAERRLQIANDHLEIRVIERTIELEKSNRATRESEQGFRALVEGVTDSAICLLDPTGKVVRWNSGAQRIQGYSEAEILGKAVEVFFTAQDIADRKPVEQLKQVAQSGKESDEGWRVRKDGSTFWAAVIITALHDEVGNLRGFAHVARDITEVKRLEKEVLEISETEQRRMGHDLHDGLGQELTGLAFLSQNVARRLADRSLPEATELRRISTLINSTIEMTRDLAKGLLPVELGPDGLSAALHNLAARVRNTYGIPCEFRRERAVKVASHTAAIHLYRIAQEALTNAARHSHATAIWLSVVDDGNEIILSIEDDGTGIPATDANSKGMGLHLMPYRARMIGATFEVHPRQGGGTLVRSVYRKSSQIISEQ